MRTLCLALLPFALAGCVTGSATPAQRLYAALGSYNVGLTAAVAYKNQPSASPAIVGRLQQASVKALPAVQFARDYAACSGGEAEVRGVPCVTFDFSRQNLLTTATTLRNAALALQER